MTVENNGETIRRAFGPRAESMARRGKYLATSIKVGVLVVCAFGLIVMVLIS